MPALSPYTYSKIGGPAESLIVVHTQSELKQVVLDAIYHHEEFHILGSGSNVLISDEGLPGLTIINRAQDVHIHGNSVVTTSGTLMTQLITQTINQGLAGLEEFLGIPGTVGGAIYNNSHHLEHLIGDHVTSVEIIDESGKTQKLSREDCRFAYDSSVFQGSTAVIIGVTFALLPGKPDELQALAKAALLRRRRTQPLEYPSSGCMFKNPPHQSAGDLIDRAGCKGMREGDAMISPKHANFLINVGRATAHDYVKLSNAVRRRVYDQFHIKLEREIFFLGNHPGLES